MVVPPELIPKYFEVTVHRPLLYLVPQLTFLVQNKTDLLDLHRPLQLLPLGHKTHLPLPILPRLLLPAHEDLHLPRRRADHHVVGFANPRGSIHLRARPEILAARNTRRVCRARAVLVCQRRGEHRYRCNYLLAAVAGDQEFESETRAEDFVVGDFRAGVFYLCDFDY